MAVGDKTRTPKPPNEEERHRRLCKQARRGKGAPTRLHEYITPPKLSHNPVKMWHHAIRQCPPTLRRGAIYSTLLGYYGGGRPPRTSSSHPLRADVREGDHASAGGQEGQGVPHRRDEAVGGRHVRRDEGVPRRALHECLDIFVVLVGVPCCVVA